MIERATEATSGKSPPSPEYQVLAFGRFELDLVQHVLREGDRQLRLGSRALEILIVLAERNGQVVSKSELLARVWPKSVVEEATLRVHIAALRKALGEGKRGIHYVQNFSGRGYRFVAQVSRCEQRASCNATPATTIPAAPPRPFEQLVGRTAVVENLAARVSQRRFVTIVGPGGIGKTAVAAAVADKVLGVYDHGVHFVDLSLVRDPRLLPAILAAEVGLTVPPERPMEALLRVLKDKSVLIVLDSCEPVVEAAASIAERILQGTRGVHILATSREPLRAANEHLHRLSPLDAPAPSDSLTEVDSLTFPAIQLFCERALANLDSFALHRSEVPLVAEICRRLDGNPLAIELAAARVNHFGVRGLAARLDDCLRLLTRGRRTAVPRHQSLRAALDWSYGLLSNREQLVLRRLAVFPDSFDIESARAVAAEAQMGEADAMDTLTDLVSKSLLTIDLTGQRVLYRLPHTNRAYAMDKLQESVEATRMTQVQLPRISHLEVPLASVTETRPAPA